MKYFVFLILTAVSGSSIQANESFSSKQSEEYDWPFYCGEYGNYHIVGACPKKKDK